MEMPVNEKRKIPTGEEALQNCHFKKRATEENKEIIHDRDGKQGVKEYASYSNSA